MYLKIEPESCEPTDKSEEILIPAQFDAEDDLNDSTEMVSEDEVRC